MTDEAIARENELGIFIDEVGNYRVLVPDAWTADGVHSMPEFAYLAAAAIVRLSNRDEVEFRRAVEAWAKDTLKKPSRKPTAN